MSGDTAPSALDALSQMLHQHRLPQALLVAARLGIADLLAGRPQSVGELARATGTHAPTLGLLLRALASAGVFAEEADGRFGLTPLSTPLRSDTPGSRRDWVISHGNTGFRVWSELLYTVQTGEPAFARVFGSSYYDYMAAHLEIAAPWDRSMDQTVGDWTGALLASYDFAPLRTLVDVGGGHGTAIAAILRAIPTLHGVLFDLPHVVAGAGPTLEAAGVADRCEVVAGDMFSAVPAGADAYLLMRVLWNWNDERAGAILRNCRQAMPERGRLLVVDLILPDGPTPPSAAFSDLNLLLEFGGRLRSESELRSLLVAAGFIVARALPAGSRLHIVEGLPVARAGAD